MSSKNWRNAILILLLLAGLVFVVDNIMRMFLSEQRLPNAPELLQVRDSLTQIFTVVSLFSLAAAIILLPIWVYKRWKEHREGSSYEVKESRKGKGGYMEYGEEGGR